MQPSPHIISMKHPQNRDEWCPSVPIGDFEKNAQFPQRGNFARSWGLPSHLP